MGITIKANLFPYRLVLQRREPLELSVQLKNESNEEKKVSLEVEIPEGLSFQPTISDYKKTIKIESFKPKESRNFVFDVFAKMPKTGKEKIFLKVLEHYNSFEYVLKSYSKSLELVIE